MSNLIEMNKEGLDWIDSQANSDGIDEYWYFVEKIEPFITQAITNGFDIDSIELILALSMRTAYENG